MQLIERLTIGFRRKVENLAHATSLHYTNDNFARPHQTLTQQRGGHKTTPAMAAGASDHVWTVAKTVALPDCHPNESN